MKQLFFYLFLCITTSAFAKQKPVAIDSSTVMLRTVDVSFYAKQPTFQYNDVSFYQETWWDRFWRKFWNIVRSILNTKAGESAITWGIAFVAVALLAFFVFKFLGVNKSGLFAKDGGATLTYKIENEDIHGIDFNAGIDKATANGNYRLATRLLYLQTLKILTDAALIDWRINKTNATYVQELKQYPQQAQFLQLTNYFDKAWYGEAKVEAEQFNHLQQSFHQFQQQIKQ